MATTNQTTRITTTETSLRVKLNLKAPEGATKNEVIRFNNELLRLAKARGFTPMKKKEAQPATE